MSAVPKRWPRGLTAPAAGAERHASNIEADRVRSRERRGYVDSNMAKNAP